MSHFGLKIISNPSTCLTQRIAFLHEQSCPHCYNTQDRGLT